MPGADHEATDRARHRGRVAIVTGGASGIGQAIAVRLAADGARVAVFDLAGDPVRPGVKVPTSVDLHVRCDVSDPDAVQHAVREVESTLGPPLVLVHAAVHQFVRPIEEVTLDEWRRVQAVNVDGLFLLTKAVLPAMREAQWGRIVAISSSTFFVGARSMTHYVTSKGAVIGFVHGLAAEVGADGITVNAVAPGLTRTPPTIADLPPSMFADVASLQAIPRTGEPQDHAGVVSFLASDDAAFLTGQTLLVDGGQGRT
jgi:2-hydroxycyclohexanecarboxyl-CoA dehydrogenase